MPPKVLARTNLHIIYVSFIDETIENYKFSNKEFLHFHIFETMIIQDMPPEILKQQQRAILEVRKVYFVIFQK